jgi:butyryl-CoA dehydrogenase
MTSSLTPFSRRDLEFQLYELFGAERLLEAAPFREHDRGTIDAVLDAAWQLADDKFAPFAAKLDTHEPVFDGERVHLIPEVAEALRAYVEAGFMGLAFDREAGGMQMPYLVATACTLVFSAANAPVNNYAFLTVGAANLLRACGSPEQKRLYMEPMIAGRFFGTMALSEPQAGSSLADIRTKAVAAANGSYLLTGSKMWISGGDHQLAENIVHLVLAKIPGGPPGVRGISLFIVPKHLVNEDGSLGARNDVRLAGLNHKMGQRGTVNTLLALGEQGRCIGYLIGEPHQGLAYMFHMMNEARIGVGAGAVTSGYAGYRHALEYAKSRPQGRPLGAKDPTTPPVPIIRHADVKRMLLAQKAYVEGGLSLILYCARLVDEQRIATDAKARGRATLLLEILTPIAKSWPAEYCLEANKLAIQVHGGYGYTRDYPVERLYRDNRLNAIHEGTAGIHGLDLLGRKVRMQGGAAFELLLQEIAGTIVAARGDARLRNWASRLESAARRVREITAVILQAAAKVGEERALANATLYLDALGHVVVAWLWLRQAAVAANAQSASGANGAFYRGKLRACAYFFAYELPRIEPTLALLETLDGTCLEAAPEEF